MVLPRRYAPMGPCSFPSPGAVCAFGFQSILASAGFLRVLRFSLLHLKVPGFPPNVINNKKKRKKKKRDLETLYGYKQKGAVIRSRDGWTMVKRVRVTFLILKSVITQKMY